MILGIGIDLLDFSQVNIQNEKLIQKVLTKVEYQSFCSLKLLSQKTEYISGRFAAKEAFVKALGTGFRELFLQDIQIENDILGKPIITLLKNEEILIDKKCHLSISHSKTAATAIVIIESL